MSPTPQCLFICTGNYYRSRYAEEVFNHHAARRGLAWRATSRGLAPDMTLLENVGPISAFALAGLRDRGIIPRAASRFPATVDADILAASAIVVVICEREHRPMLAARHPDWLSRVEFWAVEDLAFTAPDDALNALDLEVDRLLTRIASGPPGGH